MATIGHYVYLHRTADTGRVFYVGKGFGTRAWKKATRGDWWKRIEAKHGRVVEIYLDGLQEWYAFELEALLVAYYGRENLCNLTDGGQGGVNPSDETRAKMSALRKGIKFSDEHRERIRQASSKHRHTEETKQKLRVLNLGKQGRPMPESAKKVISEKAKARIRTPEHCAAISKGKTGKPGRKLTAAEIERLRVLNTGRVTPDAVRKKISESNMGKKHTPEALEKILANNRRLNAARKKPVLCSNGRRFAGSGDAEAWLISEGKLTARRSNIVSCCTGKLKTAYGYSWSYA